MFLSFVFLDLTACVSGPGASPVRGPGGESPRWGLGGKAPWRGVWAPTQGVGPDPGKGRTVGGRLFFEEKKNSAPLSAQRNFF